MQSRGLETCVYFPIFIGFLWSARVYTTGNAFTNPATLTQDYTLCRHKKKDFNYFIGFLWSARVYTTGNALTNPATLTQDYTLHRHISLLLRTVGFIKYPPLTLLFN